MTKKQNNYIILSNGSLVFIKIPYFKSFSKHVFLDCNNHPIWLDNKNSLNYKKEVHDFIKQFNFKTTSF
uniref:ribosomal protein L31 n=1 Tax=Dictyotopsis propagulifera TaxID=670095 RepID=UPI002E795766|nr:ribosomal protein L31 [Dictyotopsis propagulifera]WBP69964.1 ribosomal protein L31 [Dictyotopsis propagulifera]